MLIGRVAAWALVAATAAHGLIDDRAVSFHATLAVHLASVACFAVVVREVVIGRYVPTFGESLTLAVALRACVLPLAPALSDDIYRYLFEGRVLLDGASPFRLPPVAAELAHLRDADWELINNKSIPAAYPPAVQLANAFGASLGFGVFGIKLVFAACDLLAFVLLWRWLPLVGLAAPRAVVYGFCPLLALEFAGEGHSDSLVIAALVGVLWALARGRSGVAGAALAVAVLGKWMPVVFLPFVVRAAGRRGAAIAGFVIAGLACSLPFLTFAEFSFAGTLEYVTRWRSNDSAFRVVHALAEWATSAGPLAAFEAQRVSKIPIAALGIALLAWSWWRRAPIERVMAWFFVFFVAFAPTVHPWYVAYLVPFLALAPNPALIAFLGSVLLAYHVLPSWNVERLWRERGLLVFVEYAPFYAAYFFAGKMPRRNDHIAARSSAGT